MRLPTQDPRVDAFAHALIARRLLLEWRDITIHWVWLPLWHLVGAVGAATGHDLSVQRAVSVLASGASPLVLTALLQGRDRESYTPFLAGVLCALWPLNVVMGGTAEPEGVFQLLTLLTALPGSVNARSRRGSSSGSRRCSATRPGCCPGSSPCSGGRRAGSGEGSGRGRSPAR
ncbi:MAG: hypothetical protein IPF99_36410 [Deltaproteobacteria bacterium]|nr:hypothetical protein [Deltaproteobacteria bacterium]